MSVNIIKENLNAVKLILHYKVTYYNKSYIALCPKLQRLPFLSYVCLHSFAKNLLKAFLQI